ncbi:MAG: hypothetical protein HZC29_07615 [Thaumarchaeota archaeon]|nr:hypothetical protein [Nitrososphaerota archaeon]
MKIRTWTDRITDESNLWLNATKMEDAQNFVDASVFYLKDTVDCIKRKLLIRAALSCLCAADCLAKCEHTQDASRLYLEAATIYEENADRVIGKSIREALWSLQESYECFLLTADYYKAQQIFEKYTSLAKKVNPFFGESEAIENLRQRKKSIETVAFHSNPASLKISTDIHNAIKQLLDVRQVSFQDQENPDTSDNQNKDRIK